MKLTVITHYEINDKEFNSDYIRVEVVDELKHLIYCKGDSYHEHGKEMVEGFLDGLKCILGNELIVKYKNLADEVI